MIHTDSPKRKLIFCTKIVRLLHHNLVLKAIIVTVGHDSAVIKQYFNEAILYPFQYSTKMKLIYTE